MRYSALYNLTIKQGGATVLVKDYPEQIVMPVRGFAVGNSSEAIAFPRGFEDEQEQWDTAIERVLHNAQLWGDEYLGTWIDTDEDMFYVEPVNVFKDRSFAMGVAWARGEKAIYDLANKREIRLKVKH